MKNELIEKLNNRTAKIGVVGLGYVGLPLVIRYLEVGYPILGFDIAQPVVKNLLAGKSHIEHIEPDGIQKGLDEGKFDATTNFARAAEADAIILCLPTPLNKNREPDLSYVKKSVDTLAPYMRPGQVMVLESTTYPGTTEEEIRPRLEARGFTVGEDVFLVYSPEREDPGNPDFETRTIPKVCSGSTEACLEVGMALYQQVIDQVIPISSTRGAEMVKILENTYRAVNIALVNELKKVADRMGLDIFEIIRAAATKPFGYKAFWPGPGLGGHCIPIDPFYLTWKAREYGIETRFIELAGEVNSTMPDYVIHKVMEALNQHQKPVKGSKILILGVAYKPNVDDMRESPSLELMDQLDKLGAEIAYADPHVPKLPAVRKHSFDLGSTALTAESLAGFDLVLVSTNHDKFDWDFIKEHSKLIVDTRGVYSCDGEQIWRA